jgi:L-aspartate oxidase
MAGQHPRGDLAPRDVVAARMTEIIDAGTTGHVWLDATGLGREVLEHGFPTVTAACRKHGIDPVTAYIPVAPGAHYSCGGIRADLDGRTSIAGLYAVGEAASTGVQGANRLASNSVTEAVIAGRRAGETLAAALDGRDCAAEMTTRPHFAAEMATSVGVLPFMGVRNRCKDAAVPVVGGLAGRAAGADVAGADVAGADVAGADVAGAGLAGAERLSVAERRQRLAAAMSRYAGVLRDAEGLALLVGVTCGANVAGVEAAGLVPSEPDVDLDLDLEAIEAANLRTVSALIVAGALRRAESRGCHRRRDAAGTAGRPWHTLMHWDGRKLAVAEEDL